MHSQLWGTVTAPRPGWTGVPKHRGLLGVPAGLTTRNAGLTQTLPSQSYFLACWGLEKKSQASDFAQEVQPSLSSSRCSPPPPWTHPSTSFASCISAQPVSLRPSPGDTPCGKAWRVRLLWLPDDPRWGMNKTQASSLSGQGCWRPYAGWPDLPRPLWGLDICGGPARGKGMGAAPMCHAVCGSQEEEPNSAIHRGGSRQRSCKVKPQT